MLVSGVNAFSCSEPYNELNFNNLEFVCINVTSDSCYSYVYDSETNGSLINVYPDYAFSEEGVISGFRTKNGVVIGEFSRLDLQPSINYTFGVMCGTEKYEFNRTLVYEDAQGVNRLLVNFTNNIYYWMAILLLILIVLIIIVRALKAVRR